MKQSTTVVLIVLLIAAGVGGVDWFSGDSLATSKVAVERQVLIDVGHLDTLVPLTEGLVELTDAEVQPGFGTLVIGLHDGAEFPLVDEQVRIHGPWHEAMARTDRRGNVVFAGIAEGAYSYTIEAAGHPLLVASDPVSVNHGETTRLTLRIPYHDRKIEGWARDRHEAPVADLEITAQVVQLASEIGVPSVRRHSAAAVRTDARGRFAIAGLRRGDYEISSGADERYSAASAIVRAGTDSIVLTVAEKRMRLIEGTVTSANGDRLAGVKVMPPPGSSEPVFTDLKGYYSLTFDAGSAVGRRHLRYLLHGYQETRFELESVFDPDNPEVVVDTTLTPLGTMVTVSGRITDELGQAVAGELVQFHSPSRHVTYRTTSGPNGEFRVDGAAASDDYRVWVRPNGPYGDHNQAAVELTYDRLYFDIVLASLATGALYGQVFDEWHNPVPNFHFWVRSEKAEGRALEVVSDLDGWFSLEQVPAGRLTLGTRSRPQVRQTGIELTAGTDQHIEVVLDERNTRSPGIKQ